MNGDDKALYGALKAAFLRAPEARLVVDPGGGILLANPAAERLFSATPEELAGVDLVRLVDEASRAVLRRDLGSAEGRFSCEVRAAAPGGGPGRRLRLSGVRDETPEGGWITVVAVDLSSGAATSAAERVRELEAFLHAVAHDLAGPLGTLRGYASILARHLADRGGPAADLCVKMRLQAGRLARLLDDLMAFARLGGEPPPPADLDVDAAARAAWGDLADRVDRTGAVLEVSPDLPRVRIAPVRFQQLLLNLLSNAIKYRAEDVAPRIRVGCGDGDVPDGYVHLVVEDNGPGVPEADRNRVFELFRQRDPAREGSGVGLAIVRRIVEAEGGRVWVDGSSLGGARFHLVLPRGQAAGEAAA